MKVKPECIPCYLKQVLSTARVITSDSLKHQIALETACQAVSDLSWDATPAENSTRILWASQASLGVNNPFEAKNLAINADLLKLFPGFAQQVASSSDPVYTALLFAVAGNIIDLGILPEYDLEASISQVFEAEFAINDYREFRALAETARQIVYLGDNAGEIVLDKLLVQELAKFAPVVYVVKDAPILNDATLDDALQVQMDEIAKLITNGSGFLGTVVSDISDELKEYLRSADLIVSKGQANFETLDALAAPIFFILRAKCDCVARELGVELGEIVLKKSPLFRSIAQI